MAIKKTPLAIRFWRKVDKSGDCWLWTGSTNGRYGKMKENGRFLYAHRASVIVDGREIPDGMEIDHLCRNKLCVNPKHLDIVTPQVNVARMFLFKRLTLSRKYTDTRGEQHGA